LLRRFAALLCEHQCPHAFVDAHSLGQGSAPVNPAAPALDAVLLTARNLAAEGHERTRRVLLLDNADALVSADTIEPFLRAPLPWRVVTASRRLPECDSWRSLGLNARMIRLGPLAPEEAIALALASGVDRAEADRVARRAHGHPTLLTMSTRGRDAASCLELELSEQRDV